jgi:dynein light chain roadblock-type
MVDVALVEETEKRLRSHKGVLGFIVMNGDGIAIRSTLDNTETVHYTALVSRFVEKCRTCTRKLAADDELQFIRIRSTKHEIMIAPDFVGGTDYCLIMVQDPSTE